ASPFLLAARERIWLSDACRGSVLACAVRADDRPPWRRPWQRFVCGSEYSPIAEDRERRRAVLAPQRGRLSARRPGAALQDLAERRRLPTQAEALPNRFGQPVEQRHG